MTTPQVIMRRSPKVKNIKLPPLISLRALRVLSRIHKARVRSTFLKKGSPMFVCVVQRDQVQSSHAL